MTKDADGSRGRLDLRRGLKRLRRGRWPLAAAALALVTVGGAAAASLPWVIAGIILVALALALSPSEDGASADADTRQQPGTEDLIAAVLDPVIIADREGVVVTQNAAARSAFPWLAPGASLSLRFRTPEMQDLLRRLAEPDFQGADATYVERVPIERFFRVHAASVRNSGLLVLVFADQSETRRLDRMRADFVANASHELRTPLAAIAGFIDTLRGPARNDAAAREHFLQIMQNQTERMARLIDDLLSLSRLDMRPLVDPRSRVDLIEVVEEVVETFGPLLRETGMEITRAFPPGRAEVVGHRDELVQLFQNLLENACKYGRSGGRVAITIAAEGTGSGREFRVTVEDFGPGIPEEHIPRLTERFYRVATDIPQKGTGLGLAIVKHVLTRHNGYLTIRSEAGKGAAFTAHFPAPSFRSDKADTAAAAQDHEQG